MAISQENVEIVRRWLDAWTRWFDSPRDPDRFAPIASRYLDPDVIYEEDPFGRTRAPIAVWTPS